ncbi:hypothetical protein NM688_g1540 [Phlebia brevispora]|uniref:Uncharacterized protein n=1 Tax=Phlebia brevispora TaxID=194682 RepID=A0ACC1TAU1_9APHY|nr:hypothetical protein NM688_g1540 [Phlebia brevispora]
MALVTDPDNMESPSATAVLQQILKRLEVMSEQLSSVQPATTQSKEEDEDEEIERKLREKEEAWETVVDTLKERERGTTDSWKDELNNLLIFAGLFSAIVTAFTIVSLAWLQQDPGDATNIFLAYFSLQFSSFVVAPGHVNSSSPALPLQNVTSSFVPPPYAIPVNALWVLSLTLSLISAFFAIAVQQWLRQLQLPPGISLQKAAQLLSLRFDGMMAWQVPGVIALLPLLLQIAVVLFLAGLFTLFRALNDTITILFGVSASFALGIFLFMTFSPLVSARCPYKSPLLPTILAVVQWLSYPFYLVGMVMTLVLGLLYLATFYACFDIEFDTFESIIDRTWDKLYDSSKSFGRGLLIGNLGEFWVTRECRYISKLDDNRSSDLDGFSLLDVVLFAPGSAYTKVLRSIRDVDPIWPPLIFLKAVERSFIGVTSSNEDDYTKSLNSTPARSYKVWDIERVPSAKKWFSIRHFRLGWDLLRHHIDKNDVGSRTKAIAMFLLFTYLRGVSKLTVPVAPLSRQLLRTCSIQQITDNYYGAICPRLLLVDLHVDHLPSSLDLEDIMAFMRKCCDVLLLYRAHEGPDFEVVYLCLSYSSCALVMAVAQPPVFHAVGQDIIANIDAFFQNHDHIKAIAADIQADYKDPTRADPYNTLPPILRAISEALTNLAHLYPDTLLSDPADSSSVRIARGLLKLCETLQGDELTAVAEHLGRFDEINASHAAQCKRMAHALVGCFPGEDTSADVVAPSEVIEDAAVHSVEPKPEDATRAALSTALVPFFPFVSTTVVPIPREDVSAPPMPSLEEVVGEDQGDRDSIRVPALTTPSISPAPNTPLLSRSSSKALVPCDALVPMMDFLPVLPHRGDVSSLTSSDELEHDVAIEIKPQPEHPQRAALTGKLEDGLRSDAVIYVEPDAPSSALIASIAEPSSTPLTDDHIATGFLDGAETGDGFNVPTKQLDTESAC